MHFRSDHRGLHLGVKVRLLNCQQWLCTVGMQVHDDIVEPLCDFSYQMAKSLDMTTMDKSDMTCLRDEWVRIRTQRLIAGVTTDMLYSLLTGFFSLPYSKPQVVVTHQHKMLSHEVAVYRQRMLQYDQQYDGLGLSFIAVFIISARCLDKTGPKHFRLLISTGQVSTHVAAVH